MCIRDSDDPVRDLVTKRNEYAQAGIPEYWIVDPQAETITAVSYTHLRAHETVLDLVCRLLLEKKKNTRSQIHSWTHISTTNNILKIHTSSPTHSLH